MFDGFGNKMLIIGAFVKDILFVEEYNMP